MFNNIEMMQTAQALARHSGDRQTLIARNIANADTPGYRAHDLPSFAETFSKTTPDVTMRTTRTSHMAAAAGTVEHGSVVEAGGEPAPNGNTVSVEQQMVNAAEVRLQHDMAMAIYGKARDILRASLGRGL